MNAKFSFGHVEMFQVEEITCKMPVSMFKADEAQITENWHWLFPKFVDSDRNWDMVIQSWILIVDDKVVVVDPCNGNGRSFPHFPLFHMLDTPYIERFVATGIRPEDVDYVFCTHLHMDHCGWNTQLRGGRYVPTFPNARYILVKREYDRWDPRAPDFKPVRENEGVFENSVRPVVEAGFAQLVPDRFQLSQRLLIEPAYGHTLGHSLLHLVAEGGEARFTGDTFHHPLELKYPDLDAGTCEDWQATLATRRRLIKDCIETDVLIIPAHFPCPFGGTLHREDGEVVFTENSQWETQ